MNRPARSAASSSVLPITLPDASWRRDLRRRLLVWYTRHARDLPWRRTHDPYAIWLSEIMLQQTQVATVIAYFERFVQALPTVEALAAAQQEDVLRLWEGLGYYRRAKQLHAAAKLLVEEHGGEFPRDVKTLRHLPGIGRYTAGAIVSIAFDLPAPILEANTTRLLSRLLGYRGQPGSTAGQQLLWALAEALLPQHQAGRLNQALMELGSQVCLPRTPQCQACPVARLCRANAEGLQAVIPPPAQKPPPVAVRAAAVVVRRHGCVLLVEQPEGGRWAGLWDFPRFEIQAEEPSAIRGELTEKVRELTGVVVKLGTHLKTIKHGVTRFRITLDCYEAEYVTSQDRKSRAANMRWLRPAELDGYPLNSTGRKLARLLTMQIG